MNQAFVFDRTKNIVITLKHPDGDKKVEVRYPTDDELIRRQLKRKIFIKQQGRGASDTDIPDYSDDDLAIFNKLREGECKDVDVDGYEATLVIERICRAEVLADGVEESSGSYLVKLQIPGGEATHTIKVPSARQLFKYRRAFSSVRDLPRGRQEMTIHMEAAGELYDAMMSKTTAYPQAEGAVPINHKVVVVKTVIDEVEGAVSANDDLNF